MFKNKVKLHLLSEMVAA